MLGIEGGSGVLPTGVWRGIGIPNAGDTTFSELFHNHQQTPQERGHT